MAIDEPRLAPELVKRREVKAAQIRRGQHIYARSGRAGEIVRETGSAITADQQSADVGGLIAAIALAEDQRGARTEQPGEQIASPRVPHAVAKRRTIANLAVKPISKKPASAKLSENFARHCRGEIAEAAVLQPCPFGMRARLA